MKIGANSTVGDHAFIDSRATIGEFAKISTDASIGCEALIPNRAFVKNTIRITGTKGVVTWYGSNVVSIDRHAMTISDWKKIGFPTRYTKAQVEEYNRYIKIIEQFISASIDSNNTKPN